MSMQSIKESCFCLMATLSPNIISKWFIYSQEIQLHRSLFKLYKLQWKFKQLTSNIGKCKHTRWSQVYFQSLKLRWETQGKPGFCITINQAIQQTLFHLQPSFLLLIIESRTMCVLSFSLWYNYYLLGS